MANNLKLITAETFGDLSCNFYRNMNDDILLTREQIGTALEYFDPTKVIRKIHLKHKDRLEPLYLRLKITGSTQIGANLSKSEEQECVYYTQRGVMEICRFSRQPKSDRFIDWVWDIVEKYRNNELAITNQIDMAPITEAITSMSQTVTALIANMSEMHV